MMKNKLNLQQILKETSESVNNGHTIQKLEEFKKQLKDLDKEDKKSLKYAIKIIEEVIRLKKKRGGNSLKKIYISILLICLLGLVSGSITYRENGEMFLQGGSGNPLSIVNGLNLTTGHLFISAGDLHLDGDLIHDQGDVSFSGGTFDVAGEITATGFISQIFKTIAGTLKIQPSANADVSFFSSGEVGDADDGRELKIWRCAPEGCSYLRMYGLASQNMLVHSNANMIFQNADNKNIQFNSGQHIYLNLGDQAGSDEVRIRDDGGMEIMTIDSNGNTWSRGDLSVGVDSDVLIQANGNSYFNGGDVSIGNGSLNISGFYYGNGRIDNYFNKSEILGFDYFNLTDFNIGNYRLLSNLVFDTFVGIGTFDPKEEFHINSTHPTITFEESDGSSNEKVWELGASGDEFLIRTANDLHTGMQTIFRLGERAGTGISLIEFPQGDVVIGDLSGSGNDYACLDSTGKLFRSNTVC